MAATPGKFFVGGLNQVTTTESLKQYFEMFGEVVDAIVMVRDGRSRCFGFVTFANPGLLPADFFSQPHIVDNKEVDVKSAVPGAEPQVTKLFAGGLAPQTTTESLIAYFSQFGTIMDAIAMVDNGKARGFGFVTFASPAEAATCLSFASHIVDGKVIDLKRAEPKGSPYLAPPQVAFGGYGGFGGFQPNPYFAPQAMPMRARKPAFAGGAVSMDSAKIFVGGLQPETTEDSLMAYFSQFGTIVQCEIMRRPEGPSRGFGFVVFSHAGEAQGAIQSHFHSIDGKAVEVKACLPKEVAPPPQRFAGVAFGGRGGFAAFAPRGVPRFAPRMGGFAPRAGGFVPRYSPY